MEKDKITEFFNRLAPDWDKDMIRNDNVIAKILDNASVTQGKAVLDVACGTGVLIPDYLKRNVKSVTAIDISSEMIKIARSKFSDTRVNIICADVEDYDFGGLFDCIVVYNAFPHFPNPENLIKHLSALLTPTGALTVAHGMSRERINSHHAGAAKDVSLGLMESDELAELFSKYLKVTVNISDDEMYQVVGVRE